MQITRRHAREWAIQMLVAADLNPPVDVDAFIDEFFSVLSTMDAKDGGIKGKIGPKMKAFAADRARGVLLGLADIDAKVEALLDGWQLGRLGTVERSVMRMGVWELDNTDLPPAVVINEAVDLVNWFSSPKSRSIVNGVLDKYAKTR